MFDDRNISLDYLFIYIVGGTVQLYGIKLRLCPYMMNSFIKQIAFRWADFTDTPVIAAHIVICGKLSVSVCGVSVNQLFALIDAINCTGKGSIPLGCPGFSICLCDSYIEFFEDVGKAALCDLIPFHRSSLACRNHIADGGIYFLKDIRGIAADQDIFKLCHTLGIGHSILIYR